MTSLACICALSDKGRAVPTCPGDPYLRWEVGPAERPRKQRRVTKRLRDLRGTEPPSSSNAVNWAATGLTGPAAHTGGHERANTHRPGKYLGGRRRERGKGSLGAALTTVGLLQTICWQCFRALQSTAVLKSWHSTAEPPEHFLRSGTGPARAKRKADMRRWPVSFPTKWIHVAYFPRARTSPSLQQDTLPAPHQPTKHKRHCCVAVPAKKQSCHRSLCWRDAPS